MFFVEGCTKCNSILSLSCNYFSSEMSSKKNYFKIFPCCNLGIVFFCAINLYDWN